MAFPWRNKKLQITEIRDPISKKGKNFLVKAIGLLTAQGSRRGDFEDPEYSLDGVNYNSWPGNINLGNIISGDTLSVFIRSFVALDATGSIINTATVTSDTPDPDPGNNTDTVIVGISASADLAVTAP